MCAFDDASLRLAWIQIQVLRSLSSEVAPVPVTIYHVAELHASTEFLARVEALGAVDVVDLFPCLSKWTSLAFSVTSQLEEQEEKIYLKYYRGFLCKATGLLHAAGAAEATTVAAEGLEDGVLKDKMEEKEPAVGAAATAMTAKRDADTDSLTESYNDASKEKSDE